MTPEEFKFAQEQWLRGMKAAADVTTKAAYSVVWNAALDAVIELPKGLTVDNIYIPDIEMLRR
jgi:hypothetical protein